jgi:hypothetical protein
MTRPTVAVIPAEDESIPSMIRRLQRELGFGLEKATGLKSFRKLYDDPDPAVIQRLAVLLGVDARTLAEHTLEGRLGDAYGALGWWDYRQPDRWRCHHCGHQTIWTRLVLVSACPVCGALLSDDEVGRDLAPEQARHLQAHYLDALTRNRLDADDRIGRLWRLLCLHLCTAWPVEPDSGLEPMPRGTGPGVQRDLPWRNPDWIARFATIGWPAAETVRTFREHVKRVALRAICPDLADADLGADIGVGLGGDLEVERKRLHRQIRHWRLDERHVPDHLLTDGTPFDGCHLEAIGYAISRALRREVVHANTGHRPTKEELLAGRRPLRQTRELAGINQLLTTTAVGVEILHRCAAQLAEPHIGERIDYCERREILTAARTVPASILRQLSPAVRDRPVPARVRANHLARDAAAWIWIELARGVLHHSPHHAAARTRLRNFDRSLTPEDRLVLLEYGYQVLGAVDDDVARQLRHVGVGAVERRTYVG